MKKAAAANNVSVHGAELLRLLADPLEGMEYQEHILSLITEDSLAGKLKSRDLGNTAYHFLMASEYNDDYVLPVLRALIESTPSGLKVANKDGHYPLHLAVSRPGSCGSRDSSYALLSLLIDSFADPLGMGPVPTPPLVAYLGRREEVVDSRVVRMMIDMDLCGDKAVGVANPNPNPNPAASTVDARGNTPLHHAVSKSIVEAIAQNNVENVCDHPENVKAIEMLLQVYPEGAKSMNKDAAMPLHILCANSTNLALIQYLYGFNERAVHTADITGKTCLHHAAAAVGKCSTDALSAEERELQTLKDLTLLEKNRFKGAKGGMSKEAAAAYRDIESKYAALKDDVEEVDGGNDNPPGGNDNPRYHHQQQQQQQRGGADALKEEVGTDRSVVNWLISIWPEALVRQTTRGHVPVETVLERAKAEVKGAKKKPVFEFSQYDDPPTARILLLHHKRLFWKGVEERRANPGKIDLVTNKETGAFELDQYGNPLKAFKMSPVPERHLKALVELNFYARREALLASYAGLPLPSPASQKSDKSSSSAAAAAADSSVKKKKGRHLPQNKAKAKAKASGEAAPAPRELGEIVRHNFLGRLRSAGQTDCLRIVIEFL